MIHTDSSSENRKVRSGTWYETLNENGRIKDIFFSDEMRRMLGYESEEEFPNTLECLTEHTHPDDVHMMMGAAIAAATGKADGYDVEYRIRRKSGEYMLVNATGKMLDTPQGVPFIMYGSCIDISDVNSKAEQGGENTSSAYNQTHEGQLLNTVYSMMNFGRWQCLFAEDGSIRSVLWSDSIRSILGYENEADFPNTIAAWQNSIFPDDRVEVDAAGKVFSSHDAAAVYDVSYRMVKKDGDMIWVRSIGKILLNDDGSPQGVIGALIDITNEKRAEENSRLQRVIGALSNDYISVYGINLALDEIIIYKQRSRISRMLGSSFCNETYSAVIDKYIKSGVSEEDKAMMGEILPAEGLRRKLEEAKIFSVIFRNDQDQYCEMKAVRTGEDSLVMGFAIKDEEIRHEIKQRKELEEIAAENAAAYGIINALSWEYHTIWIIDKDTEERRLIRSTGVSTLKKAIDMGDEHPGFDEGWETYAKLFVDEKDRERLVREVKMEVVLKQIKDNGHYSVNYLRQMPDGAKGYHQVMFVDADTDDGKRQFILAFRDIDAMIKKEQHRLLELEESRAAAEAANRAKSAFLFNMSHDIRTPLNAVIGFLEMAERHSSDLDVQVECREKAMGASRQLLDILNNVLEMARIENNKVTINEELIDGLEFGKTIEAIYEGEIARKKLKIDISYNVQHKNIYADKTHMSEIFLNILDNAIKYTPEGGSIIISSQEYPGNEPETCIIETIVEDTGIGMSKDFLEHVYESFAREHSTTESHIQGTGLGLAITKRLVELMNGSMEINSRVGKGTQVIVRIPHRIGEMPHYINGHKNYNEGLQFQGMRVLMAEDNDLNAEIAMDLLSSEGIEADLAGDGIECISMLAAAPAGTYDLIFMDIQMPNMDGYKATHEIRNMEDADKSAIPIIAMTANAFKEDAEKSYEAGMNGHLSKPIDIEKLKDAIKNALG